MQPLDRRADFLEKVLEPLFFGIFNTECDQRGKLFDTEHWDKELLKQWDKLPYLNGGLFERDEVDKKKLKLPASLFEDLFSFMASYNFTVDENDPDDAEVGVDPEMLGKIFESLLEDNKAKGAFYTPKEIVRYMCKESLIAYLATQIDKSQSEGKEKSDSSDCDKYIRTFVETHEMQPELEPYREALDTALREVKICDPAIGSGAFPMGLLNELWRCREAVEETSSRVELKKEIIEKNIYGVDIEKGAIDIARLRFWLSIVVDAEEPEPLPNFDYKFMQGNSLIESFDGFDLSHIMDKEIIRGGKTVYQRCIGGKENVQVSMDFTSKDTRQNLRIWLKKYFTLTNHKEKSEYRQLINESVKSYVKQQGIGIQSEIKLNSLDPSANQDFFLWHTWFKDIFDKGGFDIVIANPPYIKEYENSRAFELLKGGKYYKAKMDIWFYFTCSSIDILKENGVLSFIAQPQWRTSDAASIMREKICEECRLIHIVDFGTYMVFDNASTQAMVMTLYKSPNKTYDLKFKLNDSIIHNSVELEGFLTSPFAHIEFDKKNYINAAFSFSTDSNASIILSKIRKKENFSIDKNREIIQGIIGSPDEAFKLKGIDISIFSEQEQAYIKPFHTSTLRYYTPQEDLYLLYLSDKNIRLTKDRFPTIYNKLLPYKESLENRREVINGKKSWYSLWWERDESFFLSGPKIVFAARTLGRNFTYTEDAFYASRNCFFIKCRRTNLKYLAALLNSKLMFYYMHNTLKHNGELLQLDKVQFLSIPLFVPPVENQRAIIEKVDSILATKHKYSEADTSSLEQEIDQQVYALYNLTPEEIAIIEQ
jgi:type I restriction-modification system DNA methylase subunit